MSTSLTCLQCGSPIVFPPGKSSYFQCQACGAAFDLIPKSLDPTAIVEAAPVPDGPFDPPEPPPPPRPASQPVVVLPPASQPVVVLPATASQPTMMLPATAPAPAPAAPAPAEDAFSFDAADASEDEDDRPARRRRRRDEDEDDEDDRDRRERNGRGRDAARRKKPDAGGAKVALLVCGGVLLLAALAVGGYFAFRPAPKEKDKEVVKVEPPPKKEVKPAPALTPDQMIKKVKASTVYIRALNRDGSGGTGSGFFAGKAGYVVTNAHVVGYAPPVIKKPDQIDVIIDSGEVGERSLAAEIYALDVELDVAVLKVDAPGLPPLLSFGKAEDLIETQEVFAFGYPLGERLGKNVSVNRTTVSSLRRLNGSVERVQVASGLNSGNSGGPLTNAKGEVIGVNVAVARGAEGIGFAIPAELARGFVEEMLTHGGQVRLGIYQFLVPPKDRPKEPRPKEPGRASSGWPPLRVAPPKLPPLGPPAFAGDAVVVKPGGAFDGACVAGGGRFLVLHQRDDNKLAVVDVTAGKVVKTIPVPEQALVAAGAESLVVIDADEDTVERWSLSTFAKEQTADLPVGMGQTATAAAMGGGSNGPLLVQTLDFPRAGERFLLDVATLKEIPGSRVTDGALAPRPGDELRASGDGRTFTQWNPEGQWAAILVTDTGYHDTKGQAQVAGTAAAPGGDGQTIYGLEEIAGRGGFRSGRGPGKGLAYVPAATGPLFLALPKSGAGKLALHAGRDRTPLAEVPVPPALAAVLDRDEIPLIDRHVFFLPAAGVLAVASPARDAMTLHKFDVDALLAKADDYLYVTSAPPPATPGKPYAYQIAVKSKRPVTGFKALTVPPGVKVSDTGRLTCVVPEGVKTTPMAVAVIDADGKEHRYEFELVPTPAPPE